MKAERPYVLINMAISADGKIASARRNVNHFSSPHDHEHLYELRATSDAVMNGARTVDTAPIKMDSGPARYRRKRLRAGLAEHPLRVIATGSGSLNPDAEVFNHDFSPIIILTTQRCPKRKLAAFERHHASVYILPSSKINFKSALAYLKKQHGVNRLLCEGGGELNDALFRADLVDEIHLTVCPVLIGGRAAPTISDGAGFARLADASRYEIVKRRRVGDELYLTYRRKR